MENKTSNSNFSSVKDTSFQMNISGITKRGHSPKGTFKMPKISFQKSPSASSSEARDVIRDKAIPEDDAISQNPENSPGSQKTSNQHVHKAHSTPSVTKPSLTHNVRKVVQRDIQAGIAAIEDEQEEKENVTLEFESSFMKKKEAIKNSNSKILSTAERIDGNNRSFAKRCENIKKTLEEQEEKLMELHVNLAKITNETLLKSNPMVLHELGESQKRMDNLLKQLTSSEE